MTCDEFEELSGAYALDAITPEEQIEADAHLAECRKCTLLLKELRSVVVLLPLSVTQVESPVSLQGRLLAALEEERREPGPTNDAPTPPPIPIRRNRSTERQRWGTGLITVAAVIMLVLFGGMTAWNISLQQQVASLSSQLASRRTPVPAEIMTYTIQGDKSVPGAYGQLIYFPQQHLTVLVMRGLPQLQGVHVYQGWLIQGKQPTSIGLLTVQNGIASVDFPGDVKGYDAAAVSMEPGPTASMSLPKGQVIAVGNIRSQAVIYKGPDSTFLLSSPTYCVACAIK